MPDIKLLNIDCMEFMASCKDKEFDLAIVDPPYNIGNDSIHAGRLGKGSGKLKNRVIQTFSTKFDDDKIDGNYFNEIFRVSKNQIIWGGNYFELPRTRGICIWDKEQPFENFSAFEYCWTSFNYPAKIFRLATTRTFENKIHPTQKPVKLYKWLLKNYAKPGDKILDTHGGSMSSAIACHEMGFDLTLCEIDKDYYEAGVKRYNEAIKQKSIFNYEL